MLTSKTDIADSDRLDRMTSRPPRYELRDRAVVASQSHNLVVAGSNPAPAKGDTNIRRDERIGLSLPFSVIATVSEPLTRVAGTAVSTQYAEANPLRAFGQKVRLGRSSRSTFSCGEYRLHGDAGRYSAGHGVSLGVARRRKVRFLSMGPARCFSPRDELSPHNSVL